MPCQRYIAFPARQPIEFPESRAFSPLALSHPLRIPSYCRASGQSADQSRALPKTNHAGTLGLCSMCGRKTRLSGANRVGARCHYEGAQFDRTGSLLWNASTPGVEVQALRRRAIAAQALYGDAAPIKILAS